MPLIIEAEPTETSEPGVATALLTKFQALHLDYNPDMLIWPGTAMALDMIGDPDPYRQDHPPQDYIAAAVLEVRLGWLKREGASTTPFAVRLRLHPDSPVHEFLAMAKAIIEHPTRWTQRALARDKSGVRVNIDESTAVRWCMNGACWKAAQDAANSYHTALRMISLLTDTVTPDTTPTWQDRANRKHGEVMAVFDKTIRANTPHNILQEQDQ